MKVLKESKEKLPISFLTDFISKGWEEVGYLKADIEAIKESFTGTKQVEELIQSLVDAYLVCIGQLEAHIHDKNYIEYPEESGLAEALNEDLEITVKEDSSIEIETDEEVTVEEENGKISIFKAEPEEEKVEEDREEFEYFVDFDEPDMSQPKLTDKDLYNEN